MHLSKRNAVLESRIFGRKKKSLVPGMAEVQSIESFCVNCERNGTTQLLLTRIPYFQDVVITSFECPHCNYKNNGVQMAGGIQPMGERIECEVQSIDDLDRQIIKSEHASVFLPALDFEIPAQTQKGIASTMQGVISQAADNLAKDQPVRMALDATIGTAIEDVINNLRKMAAGETLPFKFILDDPAGNSFIENPNAPQADSCLFSVKYERTREQLHQLGFYEEQSTEAKAGADLPENLKTETASVCWDLSRPVQDQETVLGENQITFQIQCANCGKTGNQNMCEIDIPGFRRCVIMAFVCDHCGVRNNEIKSGGAIGEQARRWTLRVESSEDLSRDILKSDFASIELPHLELELEMGTLGGVFTTVEGLLLKIVDEFSTKNPFVGDSALPERRQKIQSIIDSLKENAAGKGLPFTMILDDAADHSHIGRRGAEILHLISKALRQQSKGSVLANEEEAFPQDSQLTSITYPRTQQQNEELGLVDMKTENYEESN
eukprot:Gregarina_sp_Poly_1__9473@NODE_594_length_7275_cov_67_691593_g459_i0_p1_GENE_NODE_594_length_7275_cov_67_691593_g459_i0NODE_594_length_7275_cov_67_691593_g459_i0_p1_ORF_typecomplete_len494_score75_88zfZPR1/PF03367_13/1_4e52zfZPR1/PF03367_13/1_9e49HypA/PF01155_19/43HypA/PF01155_19/0_45Zn_Tnp_IS1595/PF12760_7/22Zn_Tnp_IS1595/PF12760_7/2e02Zn_Tnp_IS1595/PF12760_7/26zincribbons_6/PF07191_12/8_2zincribbons_6/PF07191_12/7_1OrfB_Zn_ribbon/PF07282_11/68OrfB_Zn_ribbon/PF07282_11/13_NODE_594_length_7275_c